MRILLGSLAIVFICVGCGEGFAGKSGVLDLSNVSYMGVVPKISAPVRGVSTLAAMKAESVSSAAPCAGCVGYATTQTRIASLFSQATEADRSACYTEVGLSQVAPEFADGRDFYLRQGSSVSKFKMLLVNGKLQEYRSYYCTNGVQNTAVSVVVSSGTVNYSYKYVGSGRQFSISATGGWSGGVWSSKSIATRWETQDMSNTSEITQFDQADSFARLQYAAHDYTDNTQNILLWAQAQVSVNSYIPTVGDGSAHFKLGSEAAQKPLSWDLAAGTETTNMAGLYATEANASTLPALPSAVAITFTASEVWDCTIPVGSSRVEDVATWSAAISSTLACR